jgi:hypothetical protein
MSEKWIFFRGCPGYRENEVCRLHGMEFKRGYFYKVSDAVFEYIKALRGFEVSNGVGSEEVIDFPKPKKENVASSYKRTYGPKHGEKDAKGGSKKRGDQLTA